MQHTTPAAKWAPPEVTCRICGHKHRATICNLCGEPTPHFAVIRGLTRKVTA